MRSRSVVLAGSLLAVTLGVSGGRSGWAADQIRMKSGQDISGLMARKDAEYVYLRVPRADVETVNGVPLPPPVAKGSVAPAFEVLDLSGTKQRLADHRGHVVLLQFWATWCPHCRHDATLMKELFAQYHQGDLRLITANIDATPEPVRAFTQSQQIEYPVIHEGTSGTLAPQYEVDGVPTYFLIGGDGKIVKLWYGSLTEHPNDFKDVLATLLPTTPSSSKAASPANTPVAPAAAKSPSTPTHRRWRDRHKGAS